MDSVPSSLTLDAGHKILMWQVLSRYLGEESILVSRDGGTPEESKGNGLVKFPPVYLLCLTLFSLIMFFHHYPLFLEPSMKPPGLTIYSPSEGSWVM